MAGEPEVPVLVDITVRDGGWQEVRDLERMTRRTVSGACQRGGVGGQAEVSVVFADDAFVRDLNRRYRGRDAATNVLSFPSDLPLLGDIVLARETVWREARDQGKAVPDHIAHLLVHGTLHLIGYDHQGESERVSMEALETAILLELGVANPYLVVDEQR